MGRLEIVQALVDRGADMRTPTKRGMTALDLAIDKGATEVVRAMLDAGASVSAKNPDMDATALHIAAYKGHEAVARVLLDAGADRMLASHCVAR